MSAIARRYARAAVAVAQEDGGPEATAALASGLRLVHAAYLASAELRELLNNPVLKAVRDRMLGTVLDKLKVSKGTERLVRLLARRGRIELLGEVASEVEATSDEQAGRLRAVVKSAMALSDNQVRRIAQALERRLGRPVVMSVEVDPELLAGLACRVGDLTFDSSVKRQLELVRERLES